MKRIHIEQYSRRKKVTTYTVRFEENDQNETDAFIEKYAKLGFSKDILIIKNWFRNIEERGAHERYFRHERRAGAGPILASKLRIYCIRCHDNLIILDGGGEKKGWKAQDGKETNTAMNLMNAIDEALVEKIKAEDTYYSSDGMELKGELFIDI